MSEIWFYHLERRTLEQVLPDLLERSLARGWRVVVEARSRERVEALDSHLWTFQADSFLPHGPEDDNAAVHPVLLTHGPARTNGAQVRFLVDGAPLPQDAAQYERVIVLFNGNDPDALDEARSQWKEAKATGLACQYWQQNETGRWEKKA